MYLNVVGKEVNLVFLPKSEAPSFDESEFVQTLNTYLMKCSADLNGLLLEFYCCSSHPVEIRLRSQGSSRYIFDFPALLSVMHS